MAVVVVVDVPVSRDKEKKRKGKANNNNGWMGGCVLAFQSPGDTSIVFTLRRRPPAVRVFISSAC